MDSIFFFVEFYASEKRTPNCKVPEMLFKFKYFWNRNMWQLYSLQPMKKLFLFVAWFLMVSMFCFVIIKEVIMKTEKALFCVILSFHTETKYIPLFSKSQLGFISFAKWWMNAFLVHYYCLSHSYLCQQFKDYVLIVLERWKHFLADE